MGILVGALSLTLVSCKEEEPYIEPVFPNAITESLEAGGSYTMTIEPNKNWSLELICDSESAGWFWIEDGNSQSYSLHGLADEKVSVKVCTGEQTDFDVEHSCELVLTLDGQEKTIATFIRGTVERIISVKMCQIEEGDYAYSESGDLNYVYEENVTAGSVIPMVKLERTGDSRRALLVTANFDWQITVIPEFMLDQTQAATNPWRGEAGKEKEIEISVDQTKWPLEDSEGVLAFCSLVSTDPVFQCKVSVEGCKDIFEIKGFQKESKFDSEGQFFQENSISGDAYWTPAEIGATGSVIGRDNLKLYTFAYFIESQWNSYWDCAEENISWLDVEFAAYEAGGNVIQDRSLTIKAAANEGKAREGMVLVMPESEAPESVYSIFPDGQNLDSKYEKYIVTKISQAKKPVTGSYLNAIDAAWMEEDGTSLNVVTSDHWLLEQLKVNEIYSLTYTNKGAADAQSSNMNCAVEGFTSKCFDYEMTEMEEASSWLNVFTFGTGNFRVEMFPDQDKFGDAAMENDGVQHKGYIVLYEDGVAFTAIECIYNEKQNDVEEGGSVAFVNPDKVDGATLVQVTLDNFKAMNEKYSAYEIDFEEDVSYAPLYVLTYTRQQPAMAEINIPSVSSSAQIMLNPWGIGWLTFDEPKIEGGKTQTVFRMAKPEAGDPAFGIVRIYDQGWSGQQAIIYCIPEF